MDNSLFTVPELAQVLGVNKRTVQLRLKTLGIAATLELAQIHHFIVSIRIASPCYGLPSTGTRSQHGGKHDLRASDPHFCHA